MATVAPVEVRIRSLRERLTDEQRIALLRRAAANAIGIIKRRTVKGVDVNGAAFAPYSKEYERLKSGTGRGTDVNLTLTGNMLGSMVILDITPERALIGFEGSGTSAVIRRFRTKRGTTTQIKMRTGDYASHNLKRQPKAPRVANSLKALGNDRRRHFFGVSDEERAAIIADLQQTLKLKP